MNKLVEQVARRFTPSPAVSPLVNAELFNDSFYHPNLGGITKGGMSNHYPMTIMSLSGLGAIDDEIKHFRHQWPRYRAHIRDDLGLRDINEINLDNWPLFLGQTHELLAFRRVFREGLDTLGSEKFVTKALNTMQLSLPMGLFHPLIQLSFATSHGDHGLIANALAYMAIRYTNLFIRSPCILNNSGVKSITALSSWSIIRQQMNTIAIHFQPAGGTLRICEQLCSEPNIQQLSFAKGFVINEENLSTRMIEICQASIRLYLHEPALTTLHAVTSTQALADLTLRYGTHGSNRTTYAKLWSLMWIWLSGLYLEKGAPDKLPIVAREAKNKFEHWDVIALKARRMPEVHLIKMVFSCKWLYENIELNEIYRITAMNIITEGNAHPTRVKWTEPESLLNQNSDIN